MLGWMCDGWREREKGRKRGNEEKRGTGRDGIREGETKPESKVNDTSIKRKYITKQSNEYYIPAPNEKGYENQYRFNG